MVSRNVESGLKTNIESTEKQYLVYGSGGSFIRFAVTLLNCTVLIKKWVHCQNVSCYKFYTSQIEYQTSIE